MSALDFDALRKQLQERFGIDAISEEDVMSAALYPKVAEDFFAHRDQYGPVDRLDTRTFLIGPKIAEDVEVDLETGKRLEIKVLAVGKLNSKGEREVFFEMNGQPREIFILVSLCVLIDLEREKKRIIDLVHESGSLGGERDARSSQGGQERARLGGRAHARRHSRRQGARGRAREQGPADDCPIGNEDGDGRAGTV